PGLGYEIPEELDAVNLRPKATECFERSAELYTKMRKQFPSDIAQYAVLFGYKIRWMMGMNFREAMHLIELRTTPQGNTEYRRVCQKMMKTISGQYPELAGKMNFVDFNDYYWAREESEARQRRKEIDLDKKFKSI